MTGDMKVMREETLGPVLPVAPFDTEEEAVQLANTGDFGLAASVWTRDSRRGEALSSRIKAGTVMVNDAISCFGIAEAPHGGFKLSGIGRTHGEMGLAEMVQLEVRGRRPTARDAEAVVVRLQPGTGPADGWFHGSDVRGKAGHEAARSAEVHRFAAPRKSHLRQDIYLSVADLRKLFSRPRRGRSPPRS